MKCNRCIHYNVCLGYRNIDFDGDSNSCLFAEERHNSEWIEEIIEELESRKEYGTEYAQAMEDVITILKAKTKIEYRNTLQQILDSGILTHQYKRDALEYAISLIQKEIDGELE